ncbi:Uncharacterised protein [Mycobacterium tuberculosis]|uniref:Uncharacterized protein n=1 Tax=Mycobacterium tuberculosis TaxID=1773 RepID=A0A0T9EYU4_MYCTX|nr:Uncharacterised protein [Mycobacterium tuberculosis]CKT52813.1 Uncharacterised protein [Mycobacterium tuberculosis]CKU06616.1 Uncharacterised protein [Mycobacterium tuberculosis]CKU66397.1 Uncharacterised protein [Mycobacterium tuberculosis]CKU71080.1 Uncharacterised protein [Mycobacterium tuberculosis]
MCGGADSGGYHDRAGVSGDDGAALKQHAGPVGVVDGDGVHLLVHR